MIIVGFPGNNPSLRGSNAEDFIYGNSIGTVTFNAGSDRIFGLASDDRISGDGKTIAAGFRGGDDVIQGGAGVDWIYGDAYDAQNDSQGSLYGWGGNDVLYQNAAAYDPDDPGQNSIFGGYLVGDAYRLEAGSHGGHDRLYGDGTLIGDSYDTMTSAKGGNDRLDATSAMGAATLFGDSQGDLAGNSRGGNDQLLGGGEQDLLRGDGNTLGDTARGGNDQLHGNGGNDDLRGDGNVLVVRAVGGNDTLRGGSGDDTLYGDGSYLDDFAKGGDDRLFGQGGDDSLWGDGELLGGASGGKDRFFFSGSFGDDSILDFRQADGDQIILQGLTQSEVQLSIVTVNAANDSLLLTTLGDDSITLVGFTGSLTPGVDIVFA